VDRSGIYEEKSFSPRAGSFPGEMAGSPQRDRQLTVDSMAGNQGIQMPYLHHVRSVDGPNMQTGGHNFQFDAGDLIAISMNATLSAAIKIGKPKVFARAQFHPGSNQHAVDI
jgi:hypothetical protein